MGRLERLARRSEFLGEAWHCLPPPLKLLVWSGSFVVLSAFLALAELVGLAPLPAQLLDELTRPLLRE